MTKQVFVTALIVIAFGIYVPWLKGLDFLDPVFILAYALLAVLFVAPASAEAFATQRGRFQISEVVRRGGMLVAYGWGISLLILIAGLMTVNLTHRRHNILLPSGRLLAATLLLSASACFAIVFMNALLTRRFSPRAIKGIMRIIFLLILIAVAFGERILPEKMRSAITRSMTTRGITEFSWIGALGLSAITVLLFVLLVRHHHAGAKEKF